MIFTALILGLASSLHCVGMCGPIAFMLPLDRNDPARKARQLLSYHLGRALSYGLLGLVFGLVGRALYLAGIQQKLSIVLGVLMILMTVIPEKKWASAISGPGFRMVSSIKSGLGKRLHNQRLESLFILGMLNGILPCGMVYAALFGAISMQHPGFGALYMVVFGLGTLPLMAGVSYYSAFIASAIRSKIIALVPVAMVCMGALFILRGMDLGIPFVSPEQVGLIVKAAPDCH